MRTCIHTYTYTYMYIHKYMYICIWATQANPSLCCFETGDDNQSGGARVCEASERLLLYMRSVLFFFGGVHIFMI